MNLKIGGKVFHKTFGEGIVLMLYKDYADINFLKFGKKSIVYFALSETPFVENVNSKKNIETIPQADKSRLQQTIVAKKYTNLEIVEAVIRKLEDLSLKRMVIDEVVSFVQTSISYDLRKNDVITALDSNTGYVFLKHIKKLAKKIRAKKVELITFSYEKTEESNIKTQDRFSTRPMRPNSKFATIEDFVATSMKESFDSTVKLFFARSIIAFSLSKYTEEAYVKFELRSIAKTILDYFLYQVSVGKFLNDTIYGQPPFYNEILSSVEDNNISDEEKNNLIDLISKYLKENVIRQFLIVDGKITDTIYSITESNDLIFTISFLKLLKKDSASLDKRIVSRLTYFINKLNDNSYQVKAYSKSLMNGTDKKGFILKFEYEDNLKQLEQELLFDLYTKNDFKQLMRKHGIPANEQYLKMCLDRIDYSLRTKRIILASKYTTLKSYYRDQICREEIYRYSNPLNLDEYDTIMKSLLGELSIIEVGNGVYLTRKNMEKNGINELVISDFQNSVERFGHKMSFFSLNELRSTMISNLIIDYCGTEDNQLLQFIKPIKNIKIIRLGKKDVILSFSSSKHYRGEFVEFLMTDKKSADIYDLQDFARQAFGVEYPIEELVKDANQTDFYYSEEMEKIYRNKELYIKEIYYDGN